MKLTFFTEDELIEYLNNKNIQADKQLVKNVLRFHDEFGYSLERAVKSSLRPISEYDTKFKMGKSLLRKILFIKNDDIKSYKRELTDIRDVLDIALNDMDDEIARKRISSKFYTSAFDLRILNKLDWRHPRDAYFQNCKVNDDIDILNKYVTKYILNGKSYDEFLGRIQESEQPVNE
ncbi:MAG: hypothetical protein IJ538_00485 [Clostridia bacterium]|nr:hypothetical protein [Clostridia bacterium]